MEELDRRVHQMMARARGFGEQHGTELSHEEISALLNGKIIDLASLEMFRASRVNAHEIDDAAKQWLHRCVQDWPPIQAHWTVSPEHYHYSFDGVSREDLLQIYPGGLMCGWLEVGQLQSVLHHCSNMPTSEIWRRSDYKVARAIEWWNRGREASPVFINLMPKGDSVCIGGGNHRFAVAVAIGEKEVPVIFKPGTAPQITQLVRVRSIA